ncbi:MAG: glycosyltransferase family 2 protein [Solirubrobacteraceae bacterium]
MKFSVLIPAHNEAESVGLTVESCVEKLQAAEIDYEILVVDDASGDGTSQVVQAIAAQPRVRCLRSPLPSGFGHTVRAGLEAPTGDAVAIMMADLSGRPVKCTR